MAPQHWGSDWVGIELKQYLGQNAIQKFTIYTGNQEMLENRHNAWQIPFPIMKLESFHWEKWLDSLEVMDRSNN